MVNFRLDSKADVDGTHGIGSIFVIPKRLIGCFGLPNEADQYKCSGTYCFVDGAGGVYTLYDWKATSLFCDGDEEGEESSLPSPEKFWGNEKPVELYIGGREGGDVAAFKEWLALKVA